MSSSTFRPPEHLRHFPNPPPNTSLWEKTSHALPLPLHLLLVGISTVFNVLIAIVAHVLDGPVKVEALCFHGMFIFKVFTDFTVPELAAYARVAPASVRIRGDALLRAAVRTAAGLDPVPTLPPPHQDHKGAATAADSAAEDDPGYWSSSSVGTGVVGSVALNPATLRRVPGEWVVHRSFKPKPKAETRVVLYLHGGAGYLLSPRTHRGLISAISGTSDCPVYALDYRLAPEAIFPAAVEDSIAAYCALLGIHRVPAHAAHQPQSAFLGKSFQARIAAARTRLQVFSDHDICLPTSAGNLPAMPEQELRRRVGKGHQHTRKGKSGAAAGVTRTLAEALSFGGGHKSPPRMLTEKPLNLMPSQIVVAGDSAGGCIAMQMLITLKVLGLPMPAGVVLLSPFTDAQLQSDSWRRNFDSDYLSIQQRGLRWTIRNIHAANPAIADDHPIFSPVHGDLTGLCPMLIQVGDAEVLTDDSVKLHEGARAAGVDSTLELYKDMFHVFQAFPIIPASHVAIRRIGEFIKGLPSPHLSLPSPVPTPVAVSHPSALRRRPHPVTIPAHRTLHDATGHVLEDASFAHSSTLRDALGSLTGPA
ncbi:hypothetical protein HDU96_008005, partial [Phlyctochytrium bullatum]